MMIDAAEQHLTVLYDCYVNVLMMVTISSEIGSNESESESESERFEFAEKIPYQSRVQPIQSNPIQSCHQHHRMSAIDPM